MSKNSISISDIFVQKLSEKKGNLLSREDILTLWMRSGGSKSRFSYAMSVFLGRLLGVRLAKDLYTSGSTAPKYWDVTQALIRIHAPSGAIIGGEKALELHLENYTPPDILILYTRSVEKRIRLDDGREIHFRTLVSGAKTKKKNLYPLLVASSLSSPLGVTLPSFEVALLEALSLRVHDIGVEEGSVLRFLRQYANSLDHSRLGELVRYRYIRAINRLRVITRDAGYTSLYEATLSIIRNEGGGCYIRV